MIDYEKMEKQIVSIKKRIKKIWKVITKNCISLIFLLFAITAVGNEVLEKIPYELLNILMGIGMPGLLILMIIGIVLTIISLFLKDFKKVICLLLGGVISIIIYNFIFWEELTQNEIINLVGELLIYRSPTYVTFFIIAAICYLSKK